PNLATGQILTHWDLRVSSASGGCRLLPFDGCHRSRTAAAWAGNPSWVANAATDGVIRASAAASARATAVRLRNVAAVMPDVTWAYPLVGSDAGHPITKLAALNGVCWPTRISPALTSPATTPSTASSVTATWRCSGAYSLATATATARSGTTTAP